MRDKGIWFAALVVAIAAVCGTFYKVRSTVPFAYDEADYVYAGSQGTWANYVDQKAISMVEYVQKGLALMRDKSQRTSMSQFIRGSGDITFYRHYHGPMYAYWISFWKGLGMDSEGALRGSGLIAHALGAAAIFWLFLRCFPELPPAAAFVAAMMFLMNRTTLLTALTITQHMVFQTLSYLSLFTTALYLRTRDKRWWYGTAALLALATATVEISVVLIGAVLGSVVIWEWKDGWKPIAILVGRGAGCFLLTLLAIWPAGLLKLDGLKGYAYLAYMALSRKAFNPEGPGQMWLYRLKTHPLEFVLPLVAMLAALAGIRWLRYRREATPFLIYGFLFLAVTLVVTQNYTYYHGSLLATTAVVTGMVFGELWQRSGLIVRWVALAGIVLSLVLLDAKYYQETLQENAQPSLRAQLLQYLQKSPVRTLYTPFELIPPLHYYRPDVTAVGFDMDWTAGRLAADSSAARASVVCGETLCREVENAWGKKISREQLGVSRDNPETVYVITALE